MDPWNRAVVGDTDPSIVELERRLRFAQLAADPVMLDDLISNDLLFAGPDGALATKAQDLEAHASGIVRFKAHQPEELRFRSLGPDAILVSLVARLEVEVQGTPTTGTFRYTRVWSREADGKWRVAGGHVSAVATL